MTILIHCPNCNQDKPETDFCVCRAKRNGRKTNCKCCEKLINKNRYGANKEKIKEQVNIYRENHRESYLSYQRNYQKEKLIKKNTAGPL